MQNGPVLICFDLFCDVGKSLSTLVNELADDHVYQAILGFTPSEDRLGEYEKIEGEDILFVYDQKENLFKDRKLMFPFWRMPDGAAARQISYKSPRRSHWRSLRPQSLRAASGYSGPDRINDSSSDCLFPGPDLAHLV